MYSAAVITISDKGFRGEREDLSGKTIQSILKSADFEIAFYTIIPDEKQTIIKTIISACDKAELVLTTGGTGFSERDVTPEATEEVIERKAMGIAEAIRYYSLKFTPRAMLSRAISGIRGKSLIVNLPGSPKAVEESLGFILDSLKHGIDVLKGSASECARKDI